jgi:hypothetical protein
MEAAGFFDIIGRALRAGGLGSLTGNIGWVVESLTADCCWEVRLDAQGGAVREVSAQETLTPDLWLFMRPGQMKAWVEGRPLGTLWFTGRQELLEELRRRMKALAADETSGLWQAS